MFILKIISFIYSIIVMILGFGIVFWGIKDTYSPSDRMKKIGVFSIISGILIISSLLSEKGLEYDASWNWVITDFGYSGISIWLIIIYFICRFSIMIIIFFIESTPEEKKRKSIQVSLILVIISIIFVVWKKPYESDEVKILNKANKIKESEKIEYNDIDKSVKDYMKNIYNKNVLNYIILRDVAELKTLWIIADSRPNLIYQLSLDSKNVIYHDSNKYIDKKYKNIKKIEETVIKKYLASNEYYFDGNELFIVESELTKNVEKLSKLVIDIMKEKELLMKEQEAFPQNLTLTIMDKEIKENFHTKTDNNSKHFNSSNYHRINCFSFNYDTNKKIDENEIIKALKKEIYPLRLEKEWTRILENKIKESIKIPYDIKVKLKNNEYGNSIKNIFDKIDDYSDSDIEKILETTDFSGDNFKYNVELKTDLTTAVSNPTNISQSTLKLIKFLKEKEKNDNESFYVSINIEGLKNNIFLKTYDNVTEEIIKGKIIEEIEMDYEKTKKIKK